MSNNIPCPDWAALLSAYHDHQLSVKETCRVDDHLATCADCRKALAQWDTDRAHFAAAYAESTGGVDLRTAVLEELRTMKPSTTHISLSLAKFRWLLGITSFAAVACIILGGFLALRLNFEAREQGCTSIQQQIAMSNLIFADENDKQGVAQGEQATEAKPATEKRTKSLDLPVGMVNGERSLHKIEASSSGSASAFAAHAGDKTANNLTRYASKPPEQAISSTRIKSDTNAPSEANGTMNPVSTPDDSGRNYGVVNGIQMHYDMNYQLQVKDAMQGARQAQDAVRRHGGFTMDFQYSSSEGQIPTASFRGKIPANESDNVLAEIEKLGQVTSVNIAGEDLTDAFKEKYNALKHQTGTEAEATQRALSELGVQKNLVEFSATFAEPKPRERMSLARVAETTKGILKYALLAFLTLAVILLALGLLISPFVIWRRLRKRVKVEDTLEAREPETV